MKKQRKKSCIDCVLFLSYYAMCRITMEWVKRFDEAVKCKHYTRQNEAKK